MLMTQQLDYLSFCQHYIYFIHSVILNSFVLQGSQGSWTPFQPLTKPVERYTLFRCPVHYNHSLTPTRLRAYG